MGNGEMESREEGMKRGGRGREAKEGANVTYWGEGGKGEGGGDGDDEECERLDFLIFFQMVSRVEN